MKPAAYEAQVRDGVIQLLEPACLPEHTRVIVVVPESLDVAPRILSPRLANPEDAALFKTTVMEEPAL